MGQRKRLMHRVSEGSFARRELLKSDQKSMELSAEGCVQFNLCSEDEKSSQVAGPTLVAVYTSEKSAEEALPVLRPNSTKKMLRH